MLHRDAAREPHGHGRRVGRAVEPGGDRTNVRDRGGGRLHAAEVEGRLERDDAPRRRGRCGRDEPLPGERRGLAVGGTGDAARELLIKGAERRGVAATVGGKRPARDVEDGGAVEARGQQPDQRLYRRQPIRERRELRGRQIQQAVALEELALAREQRRAVTLGLRAQLAQQRRGEFVGARRRRRVDDDRGDCGRAAETLRGTR